MKINLRTHKTDCTCAACQTIRALEQTLSEEVKIKGAWMVAVGRSKERRAAIEALNGEYDDEMWDTAIFADTEYQEACVALVNLLIERMEK